MEFILQRHAGKGYTPGELWCNDSNYPASARVCYTLEPPPGCIYDSDWPYHCIPAGTYKVDLTLSGRAQRGSLWTPRSDFFLPELKDVPGYTAIRIHAGNSLRDTEGCLLVGLGQIADTLSHSRDALKAVMALYEAPCTIKIKEAA